MDLSAVEVVTTLGGLTLLRAPAVTVLRAPAVTVLRAPAGDRATAPAVTVLQDVGHWTRTVNAQIPCPEVQRQIVDF